LGRKLDQSWIIRRNLHKMADDEFEKFGGGSTLCDPRVADGVDTCRWSIGDCTRILGSAECRSPPRIKSR